MNIYCCDCNCAVVAHLITGAEAYPHRADLKHLPFWQCKSCGNFVGCHHKTKSRTRPLGCIPTNEIKKRRQEIHKTLDPIWESGVISRCDLYAVISNKIGRKYHTADIRSVEEADSVMAILHSIINQATGSQNEI